MEHIKRSRRPSSRNASPDSDVDVFMTSVTPPSSGDERRMCLVCGTTDSPQRRRGPAGSKSLCNACGLHYQGDATGERDRACGCSQSHSYRIPS